MAVAVGKLAPNFTLPNQNGDPISLANFKGKNVVLYFYPKDMTPGCTQQACDFRDQYEQFKALNTEIIGISADPVERHQQFRDKHDLPFHLLSDTNKEVAKLYDVWKLKKMFGKEYYGIERSTFIIDAAGIVQKIYRKVRVKGHIAETAAFIKENLV